MPKKNEKYRLYESLIHQKEKDFKVYLKNHFYGTRIVDQLDKWSECVDVLIFSGVIRDYFLERNFSFRDLDVVLSSVDEKYFIEGTKFKLNQFGGAKLLIDDNYVDVWQIKDTWGLKKLGMLPFPDNLIDTSFYNFSAILYDYKRECFYCHSSFVKFLINKKIDVVYAENPLPELCVVNSIWYSHNLGLKMTSRLKKWLENHYDRNFDYEPIQQKHFGEKKYSNEEIKNELIKLKLCVK